MLTIQNPFISKGKLIMNDFKESYDSSRIDIFIRLALADDMYQIESIFQNIIL